MVIIFAKSFILDVYTSSGYTSDTGKSLSQCYVTNGLKKLMQFNVFTVGNNSDELKPL